MDVAELLARDLGVLVDAIGRTIGARLLGSDDSAAAAQRLAEEKLTKLLGEDNLVGSCGEYGLLFALLINKPGPNELDVEPALFLEDLRRMFWT